MIGPQKQKMPDKLVCTNCAALVSKEFGGTVLFPKKWIANYCRHPALKFEGGEICFICKGKPWTPKWCPVLGDK